MKPSEAPPVFPNAKEGFTGLTIADIFALATLTTINRSNYKMLFEDTKEKTYYDVIAEDCYQQAAAMMRVRETDV